MWRSSRKSSREEVDSIDGLIIRSSTKLSFIHLSFKDVENLLANDDDDDTGFNKTLVQHTPAARRLSIFHRVHFANNIARAFSGKSPAKSLSELKDLPAPETLFKSDRIISITVKSPTELKNIGAPEKLLISPLESSNVASREKLSEYDCVISIPEKYPPVANNVARPDQFRKSDGEISTLESFLLESSNIASPDKLLTSDRPILIPGSETRVVVYTTSLRVVRQTFEACRTVKSILRSFSVSIEERDLSMDSRFVQELQNIMADAGAGENGKTKLSLPKVFIGGRYVGGLEEVTQLHESGDLKNLVQRLSAMNSGYCEVCGEFRFILCDECRGSHKLYTEKGGFRSCTLCNENGLIRCSFCLDR